MLEETKIMETRPLHTAVIRMTVPRSEIGRVMGPAVQLVESASVTAEFVRAALGDGGGSGKITHYVTGDPVAYEHTAAVIGGVDGEIVALPVAELAMAGRA